MSSAATDFLYRTGLFAAKWSIIRPRYCRVPRHKCLLQKRLGSTGTCGKRRIVIHEVATCG